MRRKGLLRCCLLVAVWTILTGAPALAGEFEPGLFGRSLHFSGEGMRHWYSAPGGFQELTGVAYEDIRCQGCPDDQVACVPCHVSSCDRCHAKGAAYSAAAARKSELCLSCHARAKLAAKMDKEAGRQDVHAKAGLACTDCHGAADVHGDGAPYQSMKAPGAIKAACTDCHGKSAPFNAASRPHKLHTRNLACSACHVTATLTCHSCHFDLAMKSGVKAGNFLPVKSYVLLVNYQGKVSAGGAQTLVWEGKPFVAYAPQFTHTVMAKGRGCADCHGSEAARLMAAGKSVTLIDFKEGKAVGWQGVVPAVEGKMDWAFVEKRAGQWVRVEGKPKEQWAGYATPLTNTQLKRLARKMGN